MYALGFPEVAIIILALATITFQATMIISMVMNKNFSVFAKIAWLLAIIILPVLGALCYYLTQYSGRFGFRKTGT